MRARPWPPTTRMIRYPGLEKRGGGVPTMQCVTTTLLRFSCLTSSMKSGSGHSRRNALNRRHAAGCRLGRCADGRGIIRRLQIICVLGRRTPFWMRPAILAMLSPRLCSELLVTELVKVLGSANPPPNLPTGVRSSLCQNLSHRRKALTTPQRSQRMTSFCMASDLTATQPSARRHHALDRVLSGPASAPSCRCFPPPSLRLPPLAAAALGY